MSLPFQQRQTIDTGLVQKRAFCLPEYTTTGGDLIRDLRVGWESVGRLNEARDNVILVPHFFSANSHVAGRYHADDPAPGYWDRIIGPGRAIDTERYFVLSVDSLVNLNSKDGRTVTTGPATTAPHSGKPYGLEFPLVGIPDFVRVQKALLDALEIRTLHAVIGTSMGGLQAYEWAAAFPENVRRVIAVTAAPTQTPYRQLQLELWCAPVRLDRHWLSGSYHGGPEPEDGVALAFFNILVGARHPEYIGAQFGHAWADCARDPAASLSNPYGAEQFLKDIARKRAAATTDANHLLYMTRANQTFVAGTRGSSVAADLSNLRAPTLVIQSRSDLLFPCDEARDVVARLRRHNSAVRYIEIDSGNGHYGGITDVDQAADEIRRFLDSSTGLAVPPNT